eukprot:TRINITY_DN25259_c1_g1_i1.p1 TRINITY_DN25259_c1_g1~~TRINITY_DN25259_c1_g1_i1.p1  ORF type:complete len:124 (+),score=33.70 TRINITY_DN25259_c1_g1_i1:144-515(+)
MSPTNPTPQATIKNRVREAVKLYLEVIAEAGACDDREVLLSKVKSRTEEIYKNLREAASGVAQYRNRQTAKSIVDEIAGRTETTLRGINEMKTLRERLSQKSTRQEEPDSSEIKRAKVDVEGE